MRSFVAGLFGGKLAAGEEEEEEEEEDRGGSNENGKGMRPAAQGSTTRICSSQV